jgi:hypothetical protein
MKIIVNKTNIQKGVQNTCTHCPIAFAIKRTLGIEDVEVNCDDVHIGKKVFELPYKAQQFITSFDNDKSSVEPFEFEL